jgi:hypothetical protein
MSKVIRYVITAIYSLNKGDLGCKDNKRKRGTASVLTTASVKQCEEKHNPGKQNARINDET